MRGHFPRNPLSGSSCPPFLAPPGWWHQRNFHSSFKQQSTRRGQCPSGPDSRSSPVFRLCRFRLTFQATMSSWRSPSSARLAVSPAGGPSSRKVRTSNISTLGQNGGLDRTRRRRKSGPLRCPSPHCLFFRCHLAGEASSRVSVADLSRTSGVVGP
jgi:hypothetical protein